MESLDFWDGDDLDTARVQLADVSKALDLYAVKRGDYPSELAALIAGPKPIMSSLPRDPWDEPFHYRRLDARRFELCSWGPDGRAGTCDDLCRISGGRYGPRSNAAPECCRI